MRGSTSEHTQVGIGALLVGRSTASYRIWDGIRSLDYLESRPEVDGKRMGCTGCSGGGTLTSYLADEYSTSLVLTSQYCRAAFTPV